MSANAEPEEPTRKTTAEQREARAQETLQKINAGGDLWLEALTLSNDFTDEYTGRFRAWVRRRLGRSTS